MAALQEFCGQYVIVCELYCDLCVQVSEQRKSFELRKGEAVIAHTKLYESVAAVALAHDLYVFCLSFVYECHFLCNCDTVHFFVDNALM